jgi:transcriptional regulatory protein LevR
MKVVGGWRKMKIYKISQKYEYPQCLWVSPSMSLEDIKWVPKSQLIGQSYMAQEQGAEDVVKLIDKELYRREKAIQKQNIKRNEDIFRRLIDEPKPRININENI